MAAHVREKWEIERDRMEIARLLARYRRIKPKAIVEALYAARVAEYKQALAELGALAEDAPIPNPPAEPYKLTRQMVEYDLDAIRAEWKKEYAEKFDRHVSSQLQSAFELHDEAWSRHEAALTELNEIQRETQTVELNTNVGDLIGQAGLGDDVAPIGQRGLSRKVKLTGAQRIKEKRKKVQTHGDPRWLLIADRAQARIDNLLRLIGPQEVNVNTPGNAPIVLVQGFNPDKWKAAKDTRGDVAATPKGDEGGGE